jgi:hypothetical protein
LAGWKDPIGLPVTELWVGQQFQFTGSCIYSQNGWGGAWQLVQDGWVDVGYLFSTGVYPCPMCPPGGGMGSWVSATNGTFTNSAFCYALTGQPGTTVVSYPYVSDYGFADGSTQYTWTSTASGACAGFLRSYFTGN